MIFCEIHTPVFDARLKSDWLSDGAQTFVVSGVRIARLGPILR